MSGVQFIGQQRFNISFKLYELQLIIPCDLINYSVHWSAKVWPLL